MEQQVVAARIVQIDDQLALIEKKREQFSAYLADVPAGEKSRAGEEQALKQNGNEELIELLHEKASLSYLMDPGQRGALDMGELKALVTPDIRAEASEIVKDFERKHGKATMASCSIGRCVQCVMCPVTCAGVCQNCVHCPPNGVIHKP